MGWWQRLWGAEDPEPKAPAANPFAAGWQSANEETQQDTTRKYLEQLGRALELENMAIVPRPEDSDTDLRGNIKGFPLRIRVNWSGDVRDVVFKCAEDRKRLMPYIDLDYDEKVADAAPASAAFEPDEKRIILGPKVFVEGSDAEKAAEAFRKLPNDLPQRVVKMMREQRVMYFRSRYFEFDITFADSSLDEWPTDPVRRVRETVALAVEMHLARGARPAASMVKMTPAQLANDLANKIAAQVPGAKIVARDAEDTIDVRWTEDGVPVRIALNHNFEIIDIEARAAGVGGEFTLHHDSNVTPEKATAGDAWDEVDHYVFFSKSLHVYGREAEARKEAALIQAVAPDVLDEAIALGEEIQMGMWLDEALVQAKIDELESVSDDGATAIRIAKVLARLAAALPRGAVDANVSAVRCSYCNGLWFPAPSRETCSHCGARA